MNTNSSARAVFRAIDSDGNGKIDRGDIESCLARSGIKSTDPRLAGLRSRLDVIGAKSMGPKAFAELIDDGGQLFSRATRGELVIPEFESFASDTARVFDAVREERRGSVAQYIPQLLRMPEDAFAVAIHTIDGQHFALGDAETGFTLQSSCKPLLYAAALEECGVEVVHRHVGREPSGLSFNELTLNRAGLPHNPMINAGAIMTSSLIRREEPTADRVEFLTNLVSSLAGHQRCHVNNAVWHSERETADRNFALAYHMRESGAFPPGTQVAPTLDYFFSACSIEVNTPMMASIGATLANGGVCPTTGEWVFREETVKHCLSMMYSCGMYDYSGEFAFCVGVPAKSAVSGIVLAVIPNVMGIAVWSPRLDEHGNSVRGVEFLKGLIAQFNFHNYDSLIASTKKDPRFVQAAQHSERTGRAINAASIGDVDDLKRLVACGHDVNEADYDGRTPLHLAAAEGRAEAVRFLLMQGADRSVLDRWGNAPLDDAIRHERQDVQRLLKVGRSAGASRVRKLSAA
ncbi:MAG: glutaminase A [Pseudomonadota bacterium]